MTDLTAASSPSSSVGDYIKAIWEVAGHESVASTKDVADRLSVSSASVTNMFTRLQEMGMVKYERYRGVSLTKRGHGEALRLVRRHRLIETFLLEHLGYSWQDVHDEAERLEHTVSDEFTERLAEFLGHPGHDPHGDPIPEADGTMAPEESWLLKDTTAGERVRISRVRHRDPEILDYLGERRLVPGKDIEVKEVRELDGVITVEDENHRSHPLGAPLARSIFVQAIPKPPGERSA